MKTNMFIVVVLSVIPAVALSDDGAAQKQFERDLKEVQKTHERLKNEEAKERMRDKSHDYRIKVDTNTSVGADPSKNEVNVRTTY